MLNLLFSTPTVQKSFTSSIDSTSSVRVLFLRFNTVRTINRAVLVQDIFRKRIFVYHKKRKKNHIPMRGRYLCEKSFKTQHSEIYRTRIIIPIGVQRTRSNSGKKKET